MASGQSFFQTPVGERRGVPPLRLQRSQSARPRTRGQTGPSRSASAMAPPLDLSSQSAPDTSQGRTVMEDLELIRERRLPQQSTSGSNPPDYLTSSSSSSVYQTGSSGSSFYRSKDTPTSGSEATYEKRHHQLAPLEVPEDQERYLKRPKSAVDKSVRMKKQKCTKSKPRRQEIMIPEEEELEYPPILLDCFKTKAVLAKRVSHILTPSERIGSNLTRYTYLVRIPPRFPQGRDQYSVLPYILKRNTKPPSDPKTRVVLITRLLHRRYQLWATSQMVSARIESSRLSSKSSSSTSLSGAPKISSAGMKVIKQFHLQDLLKKQEQRAAIEAAKLRSKGHKKVSKKVSLPVKYREASQLSGLEDQLQEQREERARRPLPSEEDLARSVFAADVTAQAHLNHPQRDQTSETCVSKH
ncbi:uncharacterized protein LOC122248638 [Penaeus japonicus]|uniref:uncharacterized protein LOC122248638 n=1 Tax=Penaeus japonicus TaxID=27405 RepID=UPI001C710313|nr:uncharacterized protein LOC122248638 [Penaeus japonicus]